MCFLVCVSLERGSVTCLGENSKAMIKVNVLMPKKKSWGNCMPSTRQNRVYIKHQLSAWKLSQMFSSRISRNFSEQLFFKTPSAGCFQESEGVGCKQYITCSKNFIMHELGCLTTSSQSLLKVSIFFVRSSVCLIFRSYRKHHEHVQTLQDVQVPVYKKST